MSASNAVVETSQILPCAANCAASCAAGWQLTWYDKIAKASTTLLLAKYQGMLCELRRTG